ncbi:MAG: class II aldolase/adducin family protein [Candidatus Omnitrophica bacterium]|nr:class II aldolase/adducin family protein [Candidatus Omnitrophota bacterium]MBU4302818.1 class II aldolase/adducin family protein [Candidatus Omnitrophota bacterium]MBU4419192.1 class II aldolase/adducin family protein [Candidatus Omnitrophota bacterium]MBU4468693.1 class II aldolase/adducin family protein [Candidatus Omnitrophota bacterium]MCG2707713.1 class II aldolase/adducin family protein [Candidatus Omnitrophota bacterium]
MSERGLKLEIIKVGRRLYTAGLAVAKSGNLSCRLDDESILITASGAALGQLKESDIVKVNLAGGKSGAGPNPSSELPLHSLVYKNFTAQAVIHCHPPLINGYFAVAKRLKAISFETKFYLGDIPVIPQETPTVTAPAPVIAALKTNNLVILKNHGIVAIADKFQEALSLTEALEEAVKSAAVARLFDKSILDNLDLALKEDLKRNDPAYTMFSRQHIQAIVDLVNQDEFIAQKGKELDLTVKLAIKLDDSGEVFKFNFEKGKIIKLDSDSDAPFVISAPAPVWEQVFLGKLDSFVAVTQGKMKLSGQLGQLSKWYVPFNRLFALFKEVKIK